MKTHDEILKLTSIMSHMLCQWCRIISAVICNDAKLLCLVQASDQWSMHQQSTIYVGRCRPCKVVWSICILRFYCVSAGKVFQIGTVRYNWPMSAHASQAFSIAHCTDSEDLPSAVFLLAISRNPGGYTEYKSHR